MIFIDVGGNVGGITDSVLRKNPDWKIITIEPNTSFRLEEKYKSNSNVRVIEKALWNSNSKQPFFISELDEGSSLHEEKKNLKNPKKILVDCLRATDLINSLDDEIILYLNCEGAEFEILEDLLSSGAIKKISRIIIKFHHMSDKLDCIERYKNLVLELKNNEVNFEEWPDIKTW